MSEFLNKKDLATKLGLSSTRIIEEMVARGQLTAIRLGHRTLRFRWSDVEASLRHLTINPQLVKKNTTAENDSPLG